MTRRGLLTSVATALGLVSAGRPVERIFALEPPKASGYAEGDKLVGASMIVNPHDSDAALDATIRNVELSIRQFIAKEMNRPGLLR